MLEKEQNQKLDNCDLVTANNPLECAQYSEEVALYLKRIELDHIPPPGYMRKQPEITEKMRSILVDWLVEVHLKFKLVPETLYLTINIIDRFLSKQRCTRAKL